MFSFFKKKTPSITRAQSLAGIPTVLPGVFYETNPAGEKVILVERKVSSDIGWLKNFVDTNMAPRQIILDDLGVFVFEKINGKRCVKDIIDSFAKEYKLHERESEAAVVAFINSLMKRNAVSVIFRDNPLSQASQKTG